MKTSTRILKYCIAFLIIPLNANTQPDTLKSIIEDTVSSSKVQGLHSVYASLGYGNNMVLASTVTTAQPYYYGSLVYGYKNSFYVSASSFHLPSYDPFMAYNVFGLSYSHCFNDWFDISLNASRFQVAAELTDTLFSSFFYTDASLGLDWKILYTKVSASGLFAETRSAYLQARNSRYFQTPEFLSGKAYISFDPYVNLVFGSLTKTVIDGETVIGISSPLRGSTSSGSTSGGGNGPGAGSGSTGTTTTNTTTTDYFGLMEADFGIPVALNIGNFTFEVEPGYILPLYSDPSIPSPEGFSMIMSCFIKIF